jgi:hypothetical protein
MPFRKLFELRHVINGIGAYNFAEFSHDLWTKMGFYPWSPLSLLLEPKAFMMFCVILQDYMAARVDNMRRDITVHGIPSGSRPCPLLSTQFTLRHLKSYRSERANLYRVIVPGILNFFLNKKTNNI